MSETTIKPAGASIVRAFRRINAAAEVIAAARALVKVRQDMLHEAGLAASRSTGQREYDRLEAAVTAYDATEAAP